MKLDIVWIARLKMHVVTVSNTLLSLIRFNQILSNNHKPAAASVTHNLEARCESLTRFWAQLAPLGFFFLKTLTVQLSQQTD